MDASITTLSHNSRRVGESLSLNSYATGVASATLLSGLSAEHRQAMAAFAAFLVPIFWWFMLTSEVADSAVLDPSLYLLPSPPLNSHGDPAVAWTQSTRVTREADPPAPVEDRKSTTTEDPDPMEGAETFWPSSRTSYGLGGVHIPLTFSVSGTYGSGYNGYSPGVVGSNYGSFGTGVASSYGSLSADEPKFGSYGKSALAGSSYGSYGSYPGVRVFGNTGKSGWSGWGNGKWGHYGKG